MLLETWILPQRSSIHQKRFMQRTTTSGWKSYQRTLSQQSCSTSSSNHDRGGFSSGKRFRGRYEPGQPLHSFRVQVLSLFARRDPSPGLRRSAGNAGHAMACSHVRNIVFCGTSLSFADAPIMAAAVYTPRFPISACSERTGRLQPRQPRDFIIASTRLPSLLAWTSAVELMENYFTGAASLIGTYLVSRRCDGAWSEQLNTALVIEGSITPHRTFGQPVIES